MAKYSIGNAIRKDFMSSNNPNSSKGKQGDPLTRQRPNAGVKLSDKEITELYKTNRIFANIVDIPAEDMTREWVDIEGASDDLRKQILDKLNALNGQNVFQDMLVYEALRGDGLISIGAVQSGAFNTWDELLVEQLTDIEYLHAFSGVKVKKFETVDDVFSKDYGRIQYFELAGNPSKRVHASRLLHYQTRKVEDEARGIPLIQSLYDPLLIFDNAAWSTGQILYSLLLKVLKTETDIEAVADKNDTTRAQIMGQLEYEFNTMTLALIGKDDELEFLSPGGAIGNALQYLYGFAWDYLAGAARMPKAHILGQQQGTITGGQYDSLNYYARIAGMQENYLREHIERLINLLFWASDSGVGNGKIDPVGKYKMKFRPLWRLDSKTDAEIRKLIAETDNIYLTQQVVSPDEVKELRFGQTGFMAKLMDAVDITPEELEQLAAKVEAARREAAANG